MARALPREMLKAIAGEFPADFLTTERDMLIEYGRDWTRVHEPDPSALVLPRTTSEVARFLKLCDAHRVAVVPSGGRTGLAGGAVAARGEVVLSLSRMSQMDEVDPLAMTLRVGAGAVTQAVHEQSERAGLMWPIDLAAKGSSQIGGNIATNAGGVKVIRYGQTRAWVLGLSVVTAEGRVLELNGALEKNNTGADLRQLFIGSEGTLGVITGATLKLTRPPRGLAVFLFAVRDLNAVLRLFGAARSGPLILTAFEYMEARCLERVRAHLGLRVPFHGGAQDRFYVLVEVEEPAVEGVLESWLSEVEEQGIVEDGVLARSAREAAELWALREGISESLARTGLPHKNDVALPISALGPFCADLMAFMGERYPGFEVFTFGHIGDGNLHINVMKPENLDKEAFLARVKEVDHDLFRLVTRHGGSISAEHGIGLLKKPYLSCSRSEEELHLLRAVKRALDPNGILNPGKIFDM